MSSTITESRAAASTIIALKGIYVVDGVRNGNSLDPKMLANPDVDGFLVRASWAQLEPIEGSFTWSAIDGPLAQASAAKKKITIAVAAGWQTPGWLYADGAAAFSWIWDSNFAAPLCSVQKMPLPWDPIFLSRWGAFMTALGARYDGNPNVAAVKVSAISSESWETSLPVSVNATIAKGAKSCTGYDNVTNWKNAGYTRVVMESAWDSIMAMHATAFPHKQLIPMLLPSGFPAIDDTGKVFAGREYAISSYILSHGAAQYGSQFGGQNNGLSAGWIWETLVSEAATINTGYQMTSKLGAQLGTAAATAINGGAHYLEVYQADLSDPSLTATLDSLHAKLQ